MKDKLPHSTIAVCLSKFCCSFRFSKRKKKSQKIFNVIVSELWASVCIKLVLVTCHLGSPQYINVIECDPFEIEIKLKIIYCNTQTNTHTHTQSENKHLVKEK